MNIWALIFCQALPSAQTLPKEVRLVWADATDARDLGQYELALIYHGLTLEMAQGNAELYNSRGKTYFDMAVSRTYFTQRDSLLQLAIADYTTGLQCVPIQDTVKSEILVNLGAAYGTQGKMEEALKEFNQGLTLNPRNLNGYLNQSIAHQSLGRYDKAIEDHSHYLELNPFNAEIHYERGMLYRVIDHPKEAIEDLNRALELNPDLGIAYLERARAYAKLGEKATAQLNYERAGQFGFKMEPWDLELLKQK